MADGRPRIESDDLIIDILSRLPVKTLLRFRCVCKSWRDLISNSHLGKEHLRRFNSVRRLIFSARSPLQCLDVNLLDDGVSCVWSIELPLPASSSHGDGALKLVGACNGLVCSLGDSDLIFWNPSTRVTRFVEPFRSPRRPVFYGFGYDSTIDDHKVVFGYKSMPGVMIFSLKSGLRSPWRGVYSLDCERLIGQGCLVNGALHWLDLKWENDVMRQPVLSGRIVCFDFAEETFKELVQLSYFARDQRYTSARIGIAGNSLYVYMFNNNSITMWVMNEYGVNESWSKVVQISSLNLHQLRGIQHATYINPICILENSEVLMSCGDSYLILYNPKDETFRNVLEKPVLLELEPVMFAESLISPFEVNV